MLLRSEYLNNEQLQKIAAALVSSTESSSMKSSSGSGSKSDSSFGSNDYGYGGRRSDRLNLQSTISKSRHKADLQPLHKDRNINFKPRDAEQAVGFSRRNSSLGHLEDKRITHHKLRWK